MCPIYLEKYPEGNDQACPRPLAFPYTPEAFLWGEIYPCAVVMFSSATPCVAGGAAERDRDANANCHPTASR